MRRPPSALALVAYASVSLLGLFLLYKGTTEQTMTFLMGGTVCLTLGIMALVLAIKSARWRRHMQRREP